MYRKSILSFALVSLFIVSGCMPPNAGPLPVPYRHWESNSIMSNGIRLHYWRTGGDDKPVVVMAHGITDYGLNWAMLASKLEPEYDVIMYDARGHGFSEKPEAPYSLETHVEDLVGFVQALDIHKPILIGHSMGGSVAALTAATYPDLPTAVILVDPPMDEALERLTEDILEDWKKAVVAFTVTEKQELMKQARTKYHPGLTMFEYDHWAESKQLVHPNVIDILKGPGFGDPREIFLKITAPTLILKAESKDEEYRKRHFETAALLQNGKLIHIEGAGHLIHHDKPVRTEREIRQFLADL